MAHSVISSSVILCFCGEGGERSPDGALSPFPTSLPSFSRPPLPRELRKSSFVQSRPLLGEENIVAHRDRKGDEGWSCEEATVAGPFRRPIESKMKALPDISDVCMTDEMASAMLRVFIVTIQEDRRDRKWSWKVARCGQAVGGWQVLAKCW